MSETHTAVAAPGEVGKPERRTLFENSIDGEADVESVGGFVASGDVDDFIAKAKLLSEQRERTEEEKLEYGAGNYARINSINDQLKQKLSTEMEAERKRLEEGEATVFKRIAAFFHLYCLKPVDDATVLDNVLGNEIGGLEAHMNRLGQSRDKWKGEFDARRGAFKRLTQERDKAYDLYEGGKKQLEQLEVELTKLMKARDQYVEARGKPGYNGQVESLLKNTLGGIDKLSAQKDEMGDAQEVLTTLITDYVRKTERYSQAKEAAKVHYAMARMGLDRMRDVHDQLIELRNGEQGRQSLLTMYHAMSIGKVQLDKDMDIVSVGQTVLDELMRECSKVFTQTEASMPGKKPNALETYSAELGRQEASALDRAKKMRYNLS